MSCTKKTGLKENVSAVPPLPVDAEPCQVMPGQMVSYASVVSKILTQNCMPCHAHPGSGGINLDAYDQVRLVAIDGDLLLVSANTDPQNVMMPPPPQRHLDTCQINALQLWVQQGCLNN